MFMVWDSVYFFISIFIALKYAGLFCIDSNCGMLKCCAIKAQSNSRTEFM